MESVDASEHETEEQMRQADVPWFSDPDDLRVYINSLVDRPQDYGTCVYAMSMAATAAFRYVAGRLGCTGFQSGLADMDVLRRTRSLKGPFGIVDVSNALYPQYNLEEQVRELLLKSGQWLGDQAREKLKNDTEHAHSAVVSHWKKLAAENPPAEGGE